MRKMKKISVIFLLFALLGACGSIYESEPVGIGSDFSELKKSPCACMQLDLKTGLPDWLLS